MTIDLLIQAVVRQTTILIAQLATSGGTRAPLAQVANQVFLELVSELERQGVSRKVSADMFGLGLRTYQRKIQRLTESSTDRGRSLWEAILDYVCEEKMVTRSSIQMRFARDDEVQVRGVLHGLCDSGLVFSSGQGPGAVYRATSDEELRALRQLRSGEGLDDFLWAIVYREGPVTSEDLIALTHLSRSDLEQALTRLENSNRIERVSENTETIYRTGSLFVPVGSPVGWEAAIFDHFQAMVKTICCRLRDDPAISTQDDSVGGSTYTLEQETRATLSRLRKVLVDLRRRVEEYNHDHDIPERHNQVVLYVGQCLIPQGVEDDD